MNCVWEAIEGGGKWTAPVSDCWLLLRLVSEYLYLFLYGCESCTQGAKMIMETGTGRTTRPWCD